MANDIPSSNNKRRKTNHEESEETAAALSVIQTETVECNQSCDESDEDSFDLDSGDDTIFAKGQTVFYTSSQGFAEEALVLEVHHDDLLVPYYTIRLLKDNREKQTDGAHISTLSNLCCKSKSPATPPTPLRSILRPSSYGGKRKALPVTPDCGGDEGNTISTSSSSQNFLQSVEKKLRQRKERKKRSAQVVTPDSVCERNHRVNVTPKQLNYIGVRKRKRPYDDEIDELDSTRERKRRKIATEVEGSSGNNVHSLPFYFMPQPSTLSSSTSWQCYDRQRTYPALVPSFPLDWPTNGGGYGPISFHSKETQRDISHVIVEQQMLLLDGILSRLESDTSESVRTDTALASFFSPVVTFLTSFSAKQCLSNCWESVRSKLPFRSMFDEQAPEPLPTTGPSLVVDSDRATLPEAAANDTKSQSIPTSSLHAKVSRKEEQPITLATETVSSSTQHLSPRSMLPHPPDRWQNAFAIKAGYWKCKSCFRQNPSEAFTCDVCTALRDDQPQSNDVQADESSAGDDSHADRSGSDIEDSFTHANADDTGDNGTTDDDTQASGGTEATGNDTQNSGDTGTDVGYDSQTEDSQTNSFSSLNSAEDEHNSNEMAKEQRCNNTPSVCNNQGRRLSSLALAVERIRADRARYAEFNAHYDASDQVSTSDEANTSKRFRRGRGIETTESSSYANIEETVYGMNVSEHLDVVDLDLDSILEAPMDTDEDSMSVISNVSSLDRTERMALDGQAHKRSNDVENSSGKKQRRSF